MSIELDKARLAWLDEVSSGDVRNMNEPIAKLRDPEPSAHPDSRMRLKLADLNQCYNPPQNHEKLRDGLFKPLAPMNPFGDAPPACERL